MEEKKRTRKKKGIRRKDYPPKEQVDKIQKLCEDYRGATERLKANQAKLDQVLKRQEKAESEFEKNLYEKDIQDLRKRIKDDDENTSYIRWALSELDERERTVIEQLYVDGYTWSTILSEAGEEMSVGAIDKARKRGLEMMTRLILKKKTEVQFQSDMLKYGCGEPEG